MTIQDPVKPSPVMVSCLYRGAEFREKQAEWEALLAPVISIMQGAGLIAAGFKVGTPVPLEGAPPGQLSREVTDRLRLARDGIRNAAGDPGPLGAAALPDALIIYKGAAVSLFGDAAPGLLSVRGQWALAAEPDTGTG